MEAEKKDKPRGSRNMKYLITSMDDLRDVVNTVTGIIKNECEVNDQTGEAMAIPLSCIPLKGGSHAFVISLKMRDGCQRKNNESGRK